MRRFRKLAAALLAAGSMLLASAAVAEGNADRGRGLAETCYGCHGIEGHKNTYPTFRVPKLGGQSEAYLVIALKAYRSGDRDHPTMRSQASAMSDQDIADIAAFLSTQ